MKMAKASPEDLDMAMDLISVLDDIERGFFPAAFSPPESEHLVSNDTAETWQYEILIANLRRLLNRGSIGRVIMGMAVVCDPANECIDPDADTIEHHPMRQQLEAAALWSLWHHQGASSVVGQPIRKLLGMGQRERLTDAPGLGAGFKEIEMAENMSLADQAVQALAMVKAMDENLNMEHPERHAIRNMQRIAKQVIEAGLRSATDLAWQAQDLREMARQIEAADKPHNAKVSGAGTASAGLPGWQANGETE